MLKNVPTISTNAAIEHQKYTILTGRNMLLLGNKGSGKTITSIQTSQSLEYEYKYLNLSLLEAPDLNGMPVVNQETKRMEFFQMHSFPELDSSKKKIVLICDEIDKAKDELQNPMLELFQFRSLNGKKLNIQSILATGNLPDEHSFSKPISHALLDRLSCFQLLVDAKEWVSWAKSSGLHPAVTAFIERNESKLSTKSDDLLDYVGGTPRSWEEVSKCIYDFSSLKNKNINFDQNFIVHEVASKVGVNLSLEFKQFLTHSLKLVPILNSLIQLKNIEQIQFSSDEQFVLLHMFCQNILADVKSGDMNAKHKKQVVAKINYCVNKFIEFGFPFDIVSGQICELAKTNINKDDTLVKLIMSEIVKTDPNNHTLRILKNYTAYINGNIKIEE